MNLENSGELLLFINKEKLNYNNVNNYKIYTYFCKCFLKTILEIHEKLHTTFDKNSIFIGSNVMFNVFWILLCYTNNLTLSIFLSERSVLLFTEFVVLSSDPKVNKDLSYIPNIIDAMNFAYKKTIGPIVVSNIANLKKKKNSVKNCAMIVKQIIQLVYLNNNISNLKNSLNTVLNNIINKVYDLNKIIENDIIYVIIQKKITEILSVCSIKNLQTLYSFLDYTNTINKNDIKFVKYSLLNYNF